MSLNVEPLVIPEQPINRDLTQQTRSALKRAQEIYAEEEAKEGYESNTIINEVPISSKSAEQKEKEKDILNQEKSGMKQSQWNQYKKRFKVNPKLLPQTRSAVIRAIEIDQEEKIKKSSRRSNVIEALGRIFKF
jgi:hypothetical protein